MLLQPFLMQAFYQVELLLLVLCSVNLPRITSSPLGLFGAIDEQNGVKELEVGRIRNVRQAAAASTDDGSPPWSINENVCPPILPQCQKPPVTTPSDGASEPVAPEGGSTSPFFEGDIILSDSQKSKISRARKNQLKPKRPSRVRPSNRRKDGSRSNNRRGRSIQEELNAQLANPLLALLDYNHDIDEGQRAGRAKRAIAKPLSKLWKYGVIPYQVDSTFGPDMYGYIEEAIAYYEKKTCLKFRQKNNKDPDYLFFINQPGCWSSVGHVGGPQYLSLGFGCDHLGTVIHEMGHALGFWHEQSRTDRDKYLKVITKNISPSAMDQFDVRTKEEATSRGYPYDYLSIMHYGPKYYSKNERETLQVKGIGKKLNFKIGQRRRLSDLDIAQLNDMYYCNQKDAKSRACDAGWVENEYSCYKFVKSPKRQFGGANDYCKKFDGSLVQINNEEEDKFLKDYLVKNHNDVKTWRTGGKKIDSVFKWYNPKGRDHYKMRYKAWAPNHPGKYSSMALVLYKGSPPRYVWRGIWVGSSSQLPKYANAFICEKESKVKCFRSFTGDGRDYRGKLDYTTDAITCQRWTSQYPHEHSMITGNRDVDERTNGLGNHNYCRNPGGRRARPWCYTTKDNTTWQYCDIKVCKT